MKNLIFSKFVHSFELDDDVIALYHSLMIETVFFTANKLEELKESLSEKDLYKENRDTISYLYENYFLIENSSEDDYILQKCRELHKPPTIANAYIITTENCNFNCKYCFINKAVNSQNRNKNMSNEVARAAVSLLKRTYERQKEAGEKVITFYGGEPLLNFEAIKEFIAEVDKIKENEYWPTDVRFAIVTNGSLLTKEIIAYLFENNISLGISYDGTQSSSVNRVDKNDKETYLPVRQVIEYCKSINMPFTLSITLTEEFLKSKEVQLEEIVKLTPQYVSFNLLIPNDNFKPTDGYYIRATEFIIRAFTVFRNNGIHEDRIMRKIQSFTQKKMYLYDCCASGGNQVVIAPDGSIGICHAFLNDRRYFNGSVFDDDFIPESNSDFIEWNKRLPILMEDCTDCESLGICGGGCPYIADYMGKSIFSMDNRFCLHAKRITKWMVEDLYEKTRHNILYK